MPRGDKSAYTDKQKRMAEHIEEGYERQGVSEEVAEARAWATVNKATGGGKKSGSGRGKRMNKAPMRKGGRKAATRKRARKAAGRKSTARKSTTRKSTTRKSAARKKTTRKRATGRKTTSRKTARKRSR